MVIGCHELSKQHKRFSGGLAERDGQLRMRLALRPGYSTLQRFQVS